MALGVEVAWAGEAMEKYVGVGRRTGTGWGCWGIYDHMVRARATRVRRSEERGYRGRAAILGLGSLAYMKYGSLFHIRL